MKKYVILVLIGMLILSYGVGTGLAKPDNAGNSNGKKAGVIKAVDNKIEHAEKLVERLSECSDVTELNETLNDIKDARDDLVDAINENNGTAAKTAAKELRTNWVKLKKDAHYNIVMCKSKGIGKVINKADRIADKAERLIEKFEDRGVNVTEANESLQDVMDHIDNAQEAYDAKDLKAAIQELKDAMDDLKAIIKALRDAVREKVTICHIPPDNPDNAHTIIMGRSALPAHIAHGDTIGPCGEEEEPGEEEPEGNITICHIPPDNPDNAHTLTIDESALDDHLAHNDTIGPCEEIDVNKTANETMIQSGETVTYTYNVTNTGYFNLTNITVTDDKCLMVDCQKDNLTAGESMICNCTATITENTTNEVTVTGTAPNNDIVSDSDTAYVQVIAPSIDVNKTANETMIQSGETVTYTYNVTNTGDVNLTNIVLVDNTTLDITNCVESVSTDGVLEPGETMICINITQIYVNTTNEVTVNGTAPNNDIVSDTDTAYVGVI